MLRIFLLLSVGVFAASDGLLATAHEPRKGEEESIDPLDPQTQKDSAPRPGLTFENGVPKAIPPGGAAEKDAPKEDAPKKIDRNPYHRNLPPPPNPHRYDPITLTILVVVGTIGVIWTCLRLYVIYKDYAEWRAKQAGGSKAPEGR